jgi:gliding motility-associated-like protein
MKQAEIWYFGDKAGIDFRSGTAVPLADQNQVLSFKSPAVISDSLGNLLFYSNGRKVWDRSDSLMPNGTELDGDVGVTQPCIAVPDPVSLDIVYLFTIDVLAFKSDNTYTTKGFEFTKVDMSKRGGLGDVTDIQNTLLIPAVSQKLTAVGHGNGRDYWVIAHKWDSDEFYAYAVTNTGISQPVISSAGTSHTGGYLTQSNAIGYMKASPDGKKIALAISGLNKVELFDFDNLSGTVSNATSYTLPVNNLSPYGIEFSPNGKLLYTSLLQVSGNGPPATPSRIYQFNLSAGLANPVLIDSAAGLRLGGLQLGTDGRIYVARTVNLVTREDSLDVIYNPNRPGTDCNYNQLNNAAGMRFGLAGRHCIYGLPNVVQSFVNIPVFTHDSVCFSDITRFRITNTANIDSVRWNFGDGATSTVMNPVHVYGQSGLFKVALTEIFNGKSFTDTIPVRIYPKPVITLPDSVLLYSGSSINLHAGGGFWEYEWSNGSADSIIQVSSGGDYSVRVKDFNCCYNSDTTTVKLFQYFFPNAFTPNNDGLNDIFRVVGLYRNIDLKLIIFDRWGQEVFESDSVDKGWDGTFNGQPCPAGVYSWRAFVNFLGQDIVTNGKVEFKGSVTLIR